MALFTAKVTARGGRAGHIKSDDGVLDFDIVMPNAKKKDKPAPIRNSSLRQGMLHASAARSNMWPKSKISKLIRRLKGRSAS